MKAMLFPNRCTVLIFYIFFVLSSMAKVTGAMESTADIEMGVKPESSPGEDTNTKRAKIAKNAPEEETVLEKNGSQVELLAAAADFGEYSEAHVDEGREACGCKALSKNDEARLNGVIAHSDDTMSDDEVEEESESNDEEQASIDESDSEDEEQKCNIENTSSTPTVAANVNATLAAGSENDAPEASCIQRNCGTPRSRRLWCSVATWAECTVGLTLGTVIGVYTYHLIADD